METAEEVPTNQGTEQIPDEIGKKFEDTVVAPEPEAPTPVEEEETLLEEVLTEEVPEEKGEDAAEKKEVDDELEELERSLNEIKSEMDTINQTGQELDSKSVFVGNVDWSATPENLQQFFQDCGTVNRVTILVDKASGRPKGRAYLEFVEEDAVAKAVEKSGTEFLTRVIKVTPKRMNIPGYNRARRGFRGGRSRGGRRGRAGRFRGGGWRGRARFHPYSYR